MSDDVEHKSTEYVFECALKDVSASAADSEVGVFEGYASTFGGPPDRQGDIIEKGAFAQTIRRSKGVIPVLMGHIISRVIGFGVSAEEDDYGLKVRGQFTLDSDEGRNAYATAKHAAKVGHKFGLSIGYGIRKHGQIYDDATNTRKLTSLDLYEYSMAATPANDFARFTGIKGHKFTAREIEEGLCGIIGMPRAAAKALISGGFDAIGDQRDVDGESAAGKAIRDQRDVDSESDLVIAGADFMAQLRSVSLSIALRGV